MMLTTGGVAEAVCRSLMRIQRGWSYRYQYRVIVGERRQTHGPQSYWASTATFEDICSTIRTDDKGFSFVGWGEGKLGRSL